MQVVRADLDELELPLVHPFETSFGIERQRQILIVRLHTKSGEVGYGECVASRDPGYSSETVATARWAIGELVLPWLLRQTKVDLTSFTRAFVPVRGHAMAKAAIEMALWDLVGRERRRSLSQLLGGNRPRVEVGVSVGIQPSVAALVEAVGTYVTAGYRRVKLKVKPGWDSAPVGAVRRAYPNLRLWVDANQAYSPRDAGRVRSWAGKFEVEQVEQPFSERSIDAHARLQRGSAFRVCLDESIVDDASLEDAMHRRALRSVNIKSGRVGGLAPAIRLGRSAARGDLKVWVGGMLETGIGRAANLALASTAPFDWPGDLSASDRYYADDVITRPFRLGPGSTLEVPTGPGLGIEVDARTYRRYRMRRTVRRR
ncbi:MAG: o-succinylbenzoate synthase [Thermoplasmata archaeon]